jgi:hypothetical protein
MTPFKNRIRRIAIVLFLLAAHAAAQEQIANGTFDVDIDGWATRDPQGGGIEWSPEGNPGGALKFVGDGQAAYYAAICYQLDREGVLVYSMDVYMQTNGDYVSCTLNFDLYDSTDCTGSRTEIAEIPGYFELPRPTAPNEWQRLTFEYPAGQAGTGALTALQPVLIKAGDQGGDDACLFDNVSLFLIPDPVAAPDIPAVTSAGLVVFVVLLVLAAGVVRRCSGG